MRLVIAVVAFLAIAAAGAVHAADEGAARVHPSLWVEQVLMQIEDEVAADIAAAPLVPEAISREWRSFDRQGSALGTLIGIGWIALTAIVALAAQKAVAWLFARRLRRGMRSRETSPRLLEMLGLLACDVAGLAVFVAVYAAVRRHFFPQLGITDILAMAGAAVLIRWRIAALVISAVLRPGEPLARLVEISDREACRLVRFLSVTILLVIAIAGFGRHGLMDDDSGAAHLFGFLYALIVCGLNLVIIFRARRATEALIRGRDALGMLAVMRGWLADAWLATALILVAFLLVFFVAGLSLGLLSYYHAVTATLGICFVAMVLDRLTERAWHDADAIAAATRRPDHLAARSMHRIVRTAGGALGAVTLAWIWIDAVEPSEAAASLPIRSATAAVATLFGAFVVWELVRLAIDRHLQDMMAGPSLPGTDDETGAPASRLQTVLPMLRAAFAVVIGVLASLIILSRLGVDTAPLIAGAGVFGLALSFGSQSLVRDIISGLFYMWDDAFRVGEYIDTGRLKGTVETLGIRSVKLRHQNGPLHTIPYGQLGAVTNLSRDFATIKFNLRFVPGTDIELVRKTTKQIGLAMQDDHLELAAEIMLPLKLQGVAEIVDNAVVLRFKFTARPVKPSWVQREYLKRMVGVFAEKGIQFASGPTMLLQSLPVTEPPPPAVLKPTPAAARLAPPVEEAALAEPAN